MKSTVHRSWRKAFITLMSVILAISMVGAGIVSAFLPPTAYAQDPQTTYVGSVNGTNVGVRVAYVDSKGTVLPKTTGSTDFAVGYMSEGLPSGVIKDTLAAANRTDYTIFSGTTSAHTGRFEKAYWVKDDLLATANANIITADFFTNTTKYSKAPIQSLVWDGNTGADSRTTIVLADEVATSDQGNIVLSAKTSDVAKHVVLRYFDNRAGKLVRITTANNVKNLTADTYNAITRDAVFSLSGNYDAITPANNKYALTVKLTYKRGDKANFTATDKNGASVAGGVQATLIADTSTQTETIQTYTLTVTNAVAAVQISSSLLTSVNTVFEARQETQHLDNYPLAQFNIPYVDQGGQPRQWPIGGCQRTTTIDGKTVDMVSGAQDIGYCWSADWKSYNH